MKNVAMVAVLCLGATACGGGYDEQDPEAIDDAEVAESSEALTNIDHCATGSTPNAVSHISGAFSSEQYTRLWQYIDTICPASRDTTIVTFKALQGTNHEYRFIVNPAWWEASNPGECFQMQLETRVQRRKNDGTFETIPGSSKSQFGSWNFLTGKCARPQYQFVHASNGETSEYRVRTFGLQDGVNHASVSVLGANGGPP